MAKSSEDEQKRAPRRGGKAASLLLTGLLVLGLGGFGVTSFTNTISSIGTVGSTSISVNDYVRSLQQEAANLSQQFGMQIPLQQALGFGLDRQALSTVVSRAALDETAHDLGLSVGDQTVMAEIMKQSAFTGSAGSFDREAYRFVLRQSNMTEQEFETGLRRDVSRSLLQSGVSGGLQANAALVDTVHAWIGETRDFTLLRLGEADLATASAAPDEAALRAWYDSNISRFTRPERKKLAFAALLPADIAADQTVNEETLRKLYDERIGEFMVPERRLVERIIYPDEAARDAALAAHQGGRLFQDLVTDRGLTMIAVDMGDVAKSDLGRAGDAVFAAAEGDVIAAETDLGPALFRVNGTLAGEETTFDEARADLASELQHEEAARAIADRIDEIDDLLAGGASLDELASQAGMKRGEIEHVPGAQGTEVIEGYQAFRQAADAVKAGDFPEAILLDDGGVAAIEFRETLPASPIPFEEAREQVLEAWRAEAVEKALSDRAIAMKAEVESGATLESLGPVDARKNISRLDQTAGLPAALMTQVFTLAAGDLVVFEDKGFTALLRLDAIKEADSSSDEAQALIQAISAGIEQGMAQDALQAFTQAVAAESGISLDQTAINTVNSSLQ